MGHRRGGPTLFPNVGGTVMFTILGVAWQSTGHIESGSLRGQLE
jgi:hypothetical protein